MKLSHIAIGFLLLGTTVVTAQESPRAAAIKQDTLKTTKKPALKPEKKLTKKDSLKSKKPKRENDPDYCPPCGMG